MYLNRHILGTGLALFTLVSAAGTIAAQQPDRRMQRSVMEMIVQFAANQVDQEGVGDGHCTDLVNAAYWYSGAQPMTQVTHRIREGKNFVPLSTCDWGQRFVPLGKSNKPLIPHAGCVVQFEGCGFSTDGDDLNFDHHSAIVESANGTMVTLIHQNVDGSLGDSKVRRQTVDFSGKVRGHYFVYLPLPK